MACNLEYSRYEDSALGNALVQKAKCLCQNTCAQINGLLHSQGLPDDLQELS